MASPRSPRVARFAKQAALATALWLVAALIASVQPAQIIGLHGEITRMPWRDVFADAAWHFVWWLLLTPLVVWLARRFPPAPGRLRRAAVAHLVAGLAIAVVVSVLRTLTYAPLSGRASILPLRFGAANLRYWVPQELVLYSLLVAAVVAADSYRRYLDTERRAAALNAQLARAELAVLRMQLQPHFLFNTLHAISTLVDWRPADARRMITLLSQLLRETLDFDGRRMVSLEEELEWTERYLEIERVRFEDRLTVAMNVEPEAFEARVPPFVLQPLVENAMKHGVATTSAGVTVTIEARRLDGRLRLSVVDDGAGAPGQASGEGIGLENTRRRLETLYGDEQRLVLNRRAPGFEAIVELPFTTVDSDDTLQDSRR